MWNRNVELGVGAAVVGALLTSSVLAAVVMQGSPSGLQPVAPPPGPSLTPAPTRIQQPAASWKDALTAQDFVERTNAFDQAVEAVAFDDMLRGALEDWADDRSLGELSWTAHLVLHEANRVPLGGAPQASFPGYGQSPFRGLLDHFFQPGFGPQAFGALPLPNSGQIQQESQSYSLESTPDGVTLRVETKGPDGTDTEEYEAKSMQELQALHPELFEAGGLHSLFPQAGVAPPWGGFGAQQGIRTDVLGVMAREVTSDDAASQGILVQRVLPGTIAAAVGLERGDLVVSVAGTRIHTIADVKTALRARAANASVEVEWVGPGGSHQTGTWTPSDD